MTKQAKELIAVLLVGAGALSILWGATYTRQLLGGYGPDIHDPQWVAIGIGIGAIVVAVLTVVFIRTKKA